MTENASIIALLHEVLGPLGAFEARRMFGGHGLYLDGQFFAILSDGALYFRTSEETRAGYAAEGMKPFSYHTKKGEQSLKNYWRVPERLFDEADEMRQWAVKAAVASRASASRAAPASEPGQTNAARKMKPRARSARSSVPKKT